MFGSTDYYELNEREMWCLEVKNLQLQDISSALLSKAYGVCS